MVARTEGYRPMAQVKQSLQRALKTAALCLTLIFVLGVPAQAASPEFRGVQLHSLWSDSSDQVLDRELDLASGAGANVVRVDVVWGSLETGGKGKYSPWYVAKLDKFVNGAAARGMKVLPMLWSSPCWASSAPQTAKLGCVGDWWDRGVGAYPPSDPADYGDAAGFLTGRYGDRLAALEVWNEPNLDTSFFWKTNDKAADYAGLLKAAYPRAKAGNAGVPVLAGAMAFADRPFLERLYAHGINGFHDGISVHPYNETRHPADRWKAEWKKFSLLSGTESIREAQLAAGDNTPIWVTEFGWTTGSSSGWRVSEADQAQYVRDAFPVLGNLPYVKGAVVYNLRDKGTDPSSHEDNFGLVRRDFSQKPAYAALREALTGAPAAAVRPATRKIRRVSLQIKRRGRYAVAVGRAPRLSRVKLTVSRCPSRGRALGARTSRKGRYARRLGSVRALAGCRVRATLHKGGAKVAIARVHHGR